MYRWYQRDCSKCLCMTTQVFQHHCYEIRLCRQFPCSYYKQECTQCCASCVNTRVLQSVWELHLITSGRCTGAGVSDVWVGTNPSSHFCNPQSLGWNSAADPFHSLIWRCMWRLWYFAAAEGSDNDCGFM